MSEKQWTIEEVKEQLPDVPVRLASGEIVTCQISGRRNAFASVWLPEGGTIEVGWPTLARVLSAGSAVRV